MMTVKGSAVARGWGGEQEGCRDAAQSILER